ncbi:CPBP family intramembrane glutamic endopeptidase [Paludibacter sp.]|uniref:CPBP family intramembrane glutamic endopeptidase n=1 Tax=Paludibacter sp. TaxID=1898105 RepID=UPI0025FC2612|nr:CPBP family intramembrane glutamic endopeptidase [Paludibacter sp.]
MSFIIVGIVDPVIEELIFRLPLRYQYNYIFKAIFSLVADLDRLTPEQEESIITNFRQKYFGWFFYPMAILFGCIHISNFQGYNELLLWMPLLTSIQFIAGLFLGYIRIKYGLIWSIFYHAFNNMAFISIAICSMHSFKGYQSSTNTYFVSIQPTASSSSNNINAYLSRITPDTISVHNIPANDIICTLSRTSSKYVKSYSMMPIDIDFYMKHKQQNADLARKLLLQEIQRALKISITHLKKNVNVQEAYISDPVRYNKAKMLADECNLFTLNQICRLMDNRHSQYFITSSDTIHKIAFCPNSTESFANLKKRLYDEYGISFRNVNKNLEFLIIDKESL